MSTEIMKRIRKNHGMSLDEFAELLGVPVEKYEKAEQQQCNIPKEFENKINNFVFKKGE